MCSRENVYVLWIYIVSPGGGEVGDYHSTYVHMEMIN